MNFFAQFAYLSVRISHRVWAIHKRVALPRSKICSDRTCISCHFFPASQDQNLLGIDVALRIPICWKHTQHLLALRMCFHVVLTRRCTVYTYRHRSTRVRIRIYCYRYTYLYLYIYGAAICVDMWLHICISIERGRDISIQYLSPHISTHISHTQKEASNSTMRSVSFSKYLSQLDSIPSISLTDSASLKPKATSKVAKGWALTSNVMIS